MRRVLLSVLLACLTALAVTAAPASAQDEKNSALARMVKQLGDKGRIDACDFTTQELKAARNNLPPDIEQYAPDIGTAIDAAVQARARGACRKGASEESGESTGAAVGGATTTPGGTAAPPTATAPGAQVTPTVPGQTGTPQPTPDPVPSPAASDQAIPDAVDAAPASSRSAGDAPAPLVLLIVLGLILLAAALLAAAVRWLAYEPAWLDRARHATAEAGWRTSNAWAEFTDWVRLGR